MSTEKSYTFYELWWCQRYQDGTYHVRVIDTRIGLVSGVRGDLTLDGAFQKACECHAWYVTEWRDEWPDGEQYELKPEKENEC